MNEELKKILNHLKNEYLALGLESLLDEFYTNDKAYDLIDRWLTDYEYELVLKSFIDWIFNEGREIKLQRF